MNYYSMPQKKLVEFISCGIEFGLKQCGHFLDTCHPLPLPLPLLPPPVIIRSNLGISWTPVPPQIITRWPSFFFVCYFTNDTCCLVLDSTLNNSLIFIPQACKQCLRGEALKFMFLIIINFKISFH